MSLKKLQESLQDIKDEMTKMVETAQTEQRELSSEEISKFDELEAKSTSIKDEIKTINERKSNMAETIMETREVQERKAFADFIRNATSNEEFRSGDVNFDKASNGGAVIPTVIWKDIQTKIENICPIYKLSQKFNGKGKLSIPEEDTTTNFVTGFQQEFVEMEAHASKLSSIVLEGALYGTLAKISKSLLGNSDLDLVSYVEERLANSVAKFLEDVLLHGEEDTVDGIDGTYDSTNMKVTMAGATPTADELIDGQALIKDALQSGCIWIMSNATRTAIRKLKDGENRYLLNPDYSEAGKKTLLGADVFVTDAITDGSIYYINPKTLGVKEAETYSVEILREKFSTQHALGLYGYGEIDAKLVSKQGCVKFVVAGTP